MMKLITDLMYNILILCKLNCKSPLIIDLTHFDTQSMPNAD